jgi:GalNAc-alpha-(1->4)-GalNAc-alpha-(1->3)-diNAcBac-PP-undecaprenol alpha-1,4-N-acetyl-D-galactosaminyltransferase
VRSFQPARTRAIVIADLGGGGSQRVAGRLAAAWLEAGFEVVIITLSSEVADEIPLPAGARRIALGHTGRSGNPLSAVMRNVGRVLALRQAIRDSGAREVVSFVTATNILAILACRGIGVTLSVSERNDPTRQRLGTTWELLRRYLYRFADSVTANSRQAMASLSSYVAPSRLVFVPNPLPEWSDEPPPAKARESVVLAVGRLHAQKGYDLLLPLFAASTARAQGWRLVILGEGAERQSIERLRDELGLATCVSLAGYQDDIKNWYDRAAIFIMASRHEGTANALLEAVSRGMPVIVSKTSGDGPAYVGELRCGLVIDAEDARGGAAALDRLAADPALRKQFGSAGRAGLARIISVDAIASAWERALDPAALDDKEPAAA